MSYAQDSMRSLGAAGEVSPLGIGTYLGDCTSEEDSRYEMAIAAALTHGVNLIDTSINYRCQRSERAVGRALKRLRNVAGRASRGNDAIEPGPVVCTKGGFIPLDGNPPATRQEYQSYLEAQYFESGIMSEADVVSGGHCLTAAFLSDQIRRSRRNLGLATIDLYYLHNPEQQLSGVGRDRLDELLREAFTRLEREVSAGSIRAYGCASWDGFRVPPESPNHLSLTHLVRTAREVAGDGHHFAAVQLPISLAMPEAVRDSTQELGSRCVPLLEAALELGVAVIASAPLMHSQLAQGLPRQVGEAFPELETDAQRAIAFVHGMPGVTSTLVGMRSTEHLEENLRATGS